jgi:intraflagellar transport protein 172
MNLKYLNTIHPHGDKICPVRVLSYSPSGQKLLSVNEGKLIHFYNVDGEMKDKFTPKVSDKAKGARVVVTCLCWSPDSEKVVLALSDNVITVYQLGSEWGEKRSISNKFPQTEPVTSIIWPSNQPNMFFFGLADGKVRYVNLREKRMGTLYAHSSYVTTLVISPDQGTLLSAHMDNTIQCYNFEDEGQAVDNLIFLLFLITLIDSVCSIFMSSS